MTTDGGGFQLVWTEEAGHPVMDSTPGTEQLSERHRLGTFLRGGWAPAFEDSAPVCVDVGTMSLHQCCDGVGAWLPAYQPPLALDLLTRKKEELFVLGIAEDQTDAGRHEGGVGVERSLDVGAKFVLGEVFLEGVALSADAVVVGSELRPLGSVSEHDADDEHLACKREG